MSMQCELSTTVNVSRLVVFAEMAWLERRPELGRLCREARPTGRIDDALVRRVLPELSASGARNLLRWGQTLDLWDGRGVLGKLGEAAAGTDECPVPEQGVYELWTATHPLFGGTRILHADRRRSTRDGRLDESDVIAQVPLRGVPFRSVLDPNTTVVLRDIPRRDGGPPRGKVLDAGSRATVRWRLDFAAGTNTWQLDGEIFGEGNGGERSEARGIRMRPESIAIDLKRLFVDWAARYLPRETRWDETRERLLVPLTELTPKAREEFRVSFPLEDVEVPGRGAFEEAALRDVPLAPKTAVDAQQWAESRMNSRLLADRVYRDRTQVRDLFASLVRATPLAEHRPKVPAHAALVAEHAGQPETLWTLVAAVDLAPTAPGDALLGPLSVSEEVAS